MLKSKTHRFAFFHVPKTAGSSIGRALAPYLVGIPPGQSPGHFLRVSHHPRAMAAQMIRKLGRYYCFCVVRNPWDRFRSICCQAPRYYAPGTSMRSVLELVKANSGDTMNWALPQAAFVPESDHLNVWRYEDLQAHFDEFADSHGLETELPEVNVQGRRQGPWQDAYEDDLELWDDVGEFYREDVERWYSEPGQQGRPTTPA